MSAALANPTEVFKELIIKRVSTCIESACRQSRSKESRRIFEQGRVPILRAVSKSVDKHCHEYANPILLSGRFSSNKFDG